MAPFAMTVSELARRRDAGEALCLLDVREGWELEICALPGSTHIPLGDLPRRVSELPDDRPIVVLCHLGGRSARATAYLRSQGFPVATNLEGGIDAWAQEIDPAMPRYD